MSTYTIQKNDVLGKIANQFGVDVDELAQINNIANKNKIIEGETLEIPSEPKNEKLGGEDKAGKCGNLFSLHVPEKLSECISIVPTVNDKKVPKLECNENFLFENTLKDSNKGKFLLNINDTEYVVNEDMGAIKRYQPKKPEDVRSMQVVWNREKKDNLLLSNPLSSVLLDESLVEITKSGTKVDIWQKELVSQAKVAAIHAKRTDIQIIEVPSYLSDGIHDMNDEVWLHTFSKAISENIDLNNPYVTGFVGLATAVIMMANRAEERAFWKQMLYSGKITIETVNGKKVMIFNGTKAFKEIITAAPKVAKEKALAQALKFLKTKDPILWKDKLEKIEKNLDKKLQSMKAGFVKPGIKYPIGVNHPKIALIEEFIPSSSKDMISSGGPKGNLIGLTIVVGIETFKFFSQKESERFVSDYLISIGTAVVKFAISTVAGVLAGGGLAFLAGTVAVPVIAIMGTGLLVSFFVGVWLDKLDTNFEVTKSLQKQYKESTLIDDVMDVFEDIASSVSRGGI